MERLTGLDGAFLSLESPTTHLHILGALIFDPDRRGRRGRLLADQGAGGRAAAPGPAVPQTDGRGSLRAAAPGHGRRSRLRHRLPRAPGQPPAPGGVASWRSWWPTWPRDRSTGDRPLWEFHVVEGLEGGRLALVPKVHHAIIDGVSGAEVMAAFFDLSPDPRPRPLFGPAVPRWPGRRTSGGDRAGQRAGRGRSADPSWSPDPLPGDVDQVARRAGLAARPCRRGGTHACPGPSGRRRGLGSRNRDGGRAVPPVPVRGTSDLDQPGHLAAPAGGLRRAAASATCAGSVRSSAGRPTTWC